MQHEPGARSRLVLVGMMGAGKSTVGRALAARLGWPYVDNDDLVRALAGIDAPAVAAARGVDELHRLELEALDVALRRAGPLVACAAGFAVTDPRAAAILRERATVAWLRARPETLRDRIADGHGRRADAQSGAWMAQTAAEREPAFAAVADLVLDVDERPVDDLVDELVARLAGPLPGPPGSRR